MDQSGFDNDIMMKMASGDPSAIKTLFALYFQRLFYFNQQILKDDKEAEDIAQVAMTTLWEQRDAFKMASVKDAEAFLFTVARNRCYNSLKHRQVKVDKHQALFDESLKIESQLEATLIQEDVFNRVYKEIQLLPEGQAQLLNMIFIKGMETHEIAEALNITPNNVRNQKARALEKLRTQLLRKGINYFFINFL